MWPLTPTLTYTLLTPGTIEYAAFHPRYAARCVGQTRCSPGLRPPPANEEALTQFAFTIQFVSRTENLVSLIACFPREKQARSPGRLLVSKTWRAKSKTQVDNHNVILSFFLCLQTKHSNLRPSSKSGDMPSAFALS